MKQQRAASPAAFPVPPALGRAAFLAELASVLLPLRPGSRLLVAVDGVDGAGKTRFADDLAAALRRNDGGASRQILRVGLDDFHQVQDIRYRLGRWSAEGFWLDSYNLDQFKEYVLRPLASGAGRFRNRGHDLETDAVLDPEPVSAAADAIVLIDGLFLHRDELWDCWDFSLFLDVPFETAAARLAARDGPSTGRQRYVGGQRLYFAAADPAARADLVLDNSREATLRAIHADDVSYRPGTRPG